MEKQCEQILMARGAVSEVVYCRHCRVFHVNVSAQDKNALLTQQEST